MSVETDPIPPVPEHTPPLKEDEISRGHGKFFGQVWTRWFVSLRDKINVLNESLVTLADVTGTGYLVKSGAAWLTRTFGSSSNVSVTNGDGSGGNTSFDLTDTTVTPGTYGDSTHVAQITVDAKGRITSATDVLITGGGGVTYLDDLANPPLFAFSLHKVCSTATNSIDVRRSSDNTVLAIGFVGDALDTVSLLAFTGAGNGFIERGYDQMGNGYHAVQTTAANQPRIVNAGVVDPQITFDGTSDSLSVPTVVMGTSYIGLYLNVIMPDQAGTAVIVESSTNYNSNNDTFLLYMETNEWQFGIRGTANWRKNFNVASVTAVTPIQALGQMAVAESASYAQQFWDTNTINTPTAAVGTAPTPVRNFSNQTLYIGARAGTSLYAPLKLETFAFFTTKSDDVRAQVVDIIS